MTTGKRVLVVDDQPDILGFMALTLERAGFEVHVAAGGREALELQRRHAVDIVIADIFMPEMDGIEAINRIKHDYPHTWVVAMSSGSARMQDYLKVARNIGADATLTKPFTSTQLLSLLQS